MAQIKAKALSQFGGDFTLPNSSKCTAANTRLQP